MKISIVQTSDVFILRRDFGDNIIPPTPRDSVGSVCDYILESEDMFRLRDSVDHLAKILNVAVR